MSNSSKWRVLDTGKANAQSNMDLDARLLAQLDPHSLNPILHLYDWEAPSVTYGHFIDPSLYLIESPHVQLARRPTGGGVIVHTTDWAFSVLVPAAYPEYSVNVMDNYAFVNRLVMKAIVQFCKGSSLSSQLSLLSHEPSSANEAAKHFCMAKPTRYDVMLQGKKVGGAAQRRTKSGFLHQGTISLAPPDQRLLERVLRPDTCVQQAMQDHTYALLTGNPTRSELQEARRLLAKAFQSILE